VNLLDTSGHILKIPIAHGEGRYFADEATLTKLNTGKQVLYRYCDEQGNITPAANPNGAAENIAGICNETRNVFGMMPHPERACSTALHNTDGVEVFNSLFGIAARINSN
jgi:phosphoribosylformylglycinamidine synthase